MVRSFNCLLGISSCFVHNPQTFNSYILIITQVVVNSASYCLNICLKAAFEHSSCILIVVL